MARILIIEDDPHLGLLYATELRREGHEVENALDGAAALAAIDRRPPAPPDLIVLDIKMEPMDGLEVLGEIRRRLRSVPVVINTAYPSFKADFATWGADAYVVKSSDTTELRRTIDELLTAPPD
jgi:DNA-binding response OmpR family regulator